jgi:hypothetical protein
MGRGDYLAATKGGTDKVAARAFSDKAQRSYSSQNNNQTGQSGGKIIDVKAQEESFEKDLAKQQVFKDQRKSFTQPSEIYGPDQGGGGVSYEYTSNLSDEFLDQLDLSGIGKETLDFFGVNENSKRIPVELMQMIMEGSIVGGPEAGNTTEKNVGTFGEIQGGYHPMFYNLEDYYGIMSMPQTTTYDNTPFSGGGGYGGYGGYGGRGGSGSDGGQGGYIYDMGGGFPQTYQRGQVGPGNLQEQVNQAYLSGGKGFARGGIVSLLRL